MGGSPQFQHAVVMQIYGGVITRWPDSRNFGFLDPSAFTYLHYVQLMSPPLLAHRGSQMGALPELQSRCVSRAYTRRQRFLRSSVPPPREAVSGQNHLRFLIQRPDYTLFGCQLRRRDVAGTPPTRNKKATPRTRSENNFTDP